MATIATEGPAPGAKLEYTKDELAEVGIVPWFSYSITLPLDPLPSITARSSLETESLIVRPLLTTDLDAFHNLRCDADVQKRSFARGVQSRDLEETKAALQKLQSPFDEEHWYWGAFLRSTGELTGEGGLLDTEGHSRSGWPEIDLLVASSHQRKGYGTEFYQAIVQSWWDLPRTWRRRQLHPFVMPGREPGDRQIDCVVHSWETDNTAADSFFKKVLKDSMTLWGTFEDFDHRLGRELNKVKFCGLALQNPKPNLVDD